MCLVFPEAFFGRTKLETMLQQVKSVWVYVLVVWRVRKSVGASAVIFHVSLF